MSETLEQCSANIASIPELMEYLGVQNISSERERRDYLGQLSGSELLDGMAHIGALARNIPLEDISLRPEDHVAIFEGASKSDNTFESSVSVFRVPLYHALGKVVLKDSLQVAKSLDSLEQSAEYLRLMIALTHVQRDGNGAASRFYHRLLTDGYDGSSDSIVAYQELLRSQARPADSHPEVHWTGAFAEYYGGYLGNQLNLPFVPAGYAETDLSKSEILALPIMKSCFSFYFIENGFAGVFATEFVARSGRKLLDYTIEVDGKRYTNTDMLLKDARPNEAGLVTEIGNSQKLALLNAVSQKYATGHHPAYDRFDLTRRQFS